MIFVNGTQKFARLDFREVCMGNPASAHLEFVGAMAVPLSRENPYFMHFKLAELVFFIFFFLVFSVVPKCISKKIIPLRDLALLNIRAF